MDPVFIALEPDARFTAVIAAYKDRTRSLVGNQQYLDDPPHLTLYLAVFEDAQQVSQAVSGLAAGLKRPRVTITGWHVFEADPLTGHHTLTCSLSNDDCDALRGIQQKVVDHLAPLRDHTTTLARFKPRWNSLSDAERRNVETYGFPYVGPGWHPHFTIASVRQGDWPALWESLQHDSPAGTIDCTRLCVYQLEREQPQLIEAFDLK